MPPPSTGLGGGGNSVVRSSRLPLACARASLADSSKSAKTFWSITHSPRLSFLLDSFNDCSKYLLLLFRQRGVLVLRVREQQIDPFSMGQPQVVHARPTTLSLPSRRIGHPYLPEATCARVEVPRRRVLQEAQLQSPQSVFEPEPRNPFREDCRLHKDQAPPPSPDLIEGYDVAYHIVVR